MSTPLDSRPQRRRGIVIFGVRFESVVSNIILGTLMGAVLAAYAYGLSMLKPWVASLSIAYAFYVPLNLDRFWHRDLGPEIPAGRRSGALA